MKTYRVYINGDSNTIVTDFEDGLYTVHGMPQIIVPAFRGLGRMPPNEYGNFFGREKAGAKACRELLEKYEHEEI